MIDDCNICKEGPVPVYQQLIDYLEKFITTNSPGTKLEPERELAQRFGVSRNSLRQALEYFFDRDMIVRHRRKGTFTASKKPPGSGRSVRIQDIHPLAYHNTIMFQEPSQMNTISLALFENMPFQKKFWEVVVKKFNLRHSGVRAVIEWLPSDVSFQRRNEFDSYFKSINKEPDIIQCQLDKSLYDSFAPLPPGMNDFLSGPECCLHDLLQNGGEYLLGRMLPVYVALPICLWNADMAAEYGVTDVREKLEQGLLIELAREAADKLPPAVKVSGQMPNLMRFWGHPENLEEMTVAELENFFVPLCREISKVKDDRERVFPLFFRDYPIHDKFLDKLQFMNFMLSNTMFMPLKDKITFNYETSLFPVQQSLFFSASCLGISKSAKPQKAIYDFLGFILSDEIQLFIIEALFSMPTVKSVMPELYTLLKSPPELIDKYLRRMKISCNLNPEINKYQVDYISYSLKDVFEQIVSGEINGKQAAETAFNILSNSILKN